MDLDSLFFITAFNRGNRLSLFAQPTRDQYRLAPISSIPLCINERLSLLEDSHASEILARGI